MRFSPKWPAAIVLLTLLAGGCHSGSQPDQPEAAAMPPASPLLTLERTIELPHVKGGFDLMALDAAGQRLFLAAEDNHTVEVIDMRAGRALASLPGFNEPKWVVYRPEGNCLFVSTGGDGRVTELNGCTYRPVRHYAFREACNNLRFDSLAHQLVVGFGKTFGALGLIDVARNVKAGEIPLAGYAKQFELDAGRIYVNEPALNQVEVIDRATRKPVAVWPVVGSSQNIPMGLDRAHHRLFVACAPGRLVVFPHSMAGRWPACPSRSMPTGTALRVVRSRQHRGSRPANARPLRRASAAAHGAGGRHVAVFADAGPLLPGHAATAGPAGSAT